MPQATWYHYTLINKWYVTCGHMIFMPWHYATGLQKHHIINLFQEHRLIRISTRSLSRHGPKHVCDLMRSRTYEILQQVSVQLDIKTINRSFTKTKKCLEDMCKQAETVQVNLLSWHDTRLLPVFGKRLLDSFHIFRHWLCSFIVICLPVWIAISFVWNVLTVVLRLW